MKKFIILCGIVIFIYVICYIAFYHYGIYFDFGRNKSLNTFVKTEGKEIFLKNNDNYELFEIKGVDMGAGIPGHYATDYAIDKETYLRWFKQIQEMGANTIRVYTILHDDFYEAVYEYNYKNSNPIYIIHGLWVNDYVQFSSIDAYDEKFYGKMLEDVKILCDVIHGNRTISVNDEYGNGIYNKDISPWVIGYILGVEWEDVTVAYTDHLQKDRTSYKGKYMYTVAGASPFEVMLASVGDKMFEYETNRYREQRLVAFSNWPTTDPLFYSEETQKRFKKIEEVDVENIKLTSNVISGTFASYHIYPYFPDYLSYEENVEQYLDETGKINTYQAYLKKINEHHTIPVIISEFGVPSSRGMAQRDKNTNRNQGGMSEIQQGNAIVECYRDIKEAGCAGSVVFTWQDEWFKRTWNTMHAVDLQKTPYWSDYQTNEQYFGLLSFDPGEKESVCYMDGNISEWNVEDKILQDGENYLSMKYDEKFIYFLIHKENFNEEESLYIPIDLTPKTGSTYCENYDLKFEEAVDFIISINGKDDSRIVVQERYETLRAIYNRTAFGESPYKNIPDKETSKFKNINLLLQENKSQEDYDNINVSGDILEKDLMETYETGRLIYGNANPKADDFNSLADFFIVDDNIEIKIPWQLLNFSNPSEMKIHDDYYEKYGVEEISIDEMKIGLITEKNRNKRAKLESAILKGWGKNITYHERLKASYYILQKEWTKQGGN